MKYKELTMAGFFLLILLISIIPVKGIGYIEKDDGTYYYEIDSEVRTQKITINDLITLLPQTEPENPVFGMIYLDISSKKLRFYDGFDWYNIALEKEKICNSSKDCKEWGDCINGYQTKACLIVNEYCSKSEIIEKQDCSFENPFQEKIKEVESVENITPKTPTQIATPEAPTEQPQAPPETPTETSQIPEAPTEETITGNVVTEIKGSGWLERFLDFFKRLSSVTGNIINGMNEPISEELSNINFKLEEKSLSNSDKLVAMITIQNLGEKYVPARLYYIVKDKKENEAYMEFEEIRVSKDYSITKRFDSLNLNYGSYTLNLKVEYLGISKEFKEDFTIRKIV